MSASRNRTPMVGVCGGSNPPAEYLDVAVEVGRLIARRGWILVCGGLGGVMEASCRGAKAAGGLTVGILPGVDVTAANDFVDIPIASGVGYMRNSMIITTVDAVIAIDGAEGTLSEICYALVHGKPLVVVDLDKGPSRMGGILVDKKASPGLVVVDNAADAVVRVAEALGLDS